uniref:Uncharacterized protein n=1 Tax=Anguilla anguilla TaxID=7936 RepID=A0A0E9VIT1_ANGAN
MLYFGNCHIALKGNITYFIFIAILLCQDNSCTV